MPAFDTKFQEYHIPSKKRLNPPEERYYTKPSCETLKGKFAALSKEKNSHSNYKEIMNYLEYTFQIWDKLYDKDQDPKSIIELFFHDDYMQCINGIVMKRKEYIDHVIEQKKNIKSMEFKYKNYLSQANELFIIYNAKGKNTLDDDVEAEVIAYFEFKDTKVLKIHGQVHLLKGNPSDVDMNH